MPISFGVLASTKTGRRMRCSLLGFAFAPALVLEKNTFLCISVSPGAELSFGPGNYIVFPLEPIYVFLLFFLWLSCFRFLAVFVFGLESRFGRSEVCCIVHSRGLKKERAWSCSRFFCLLALLKDP